MRNFFKKILTVISLTVIATHANAFEVKNVCAKYQVNYGWSKSYAVQTQIYSGNELNKAVGSFNRYDFISQYAIIFWSNSKASVIKITDPYVRGMMLFETKGIDQQGRHWKLSDNNLGMCL